MAAIEDKYRAARTRELPALEGQLPAWDGISGLGIGALEGHSRRREADVRGVHRCPLTGSFYAAAKFEQGECPVRAVVFGPASALAIGAEGDVPYPVGNIDGSEARSCFGPPNFHVPRIPRRGVMHAIPGFRSGNGEKESGGERGGHPRWDSPQRRRRAAAVGFDFAPEFICHEDHDAERNQEDRPTGVVVPLLEIRHAVVEADQRQDQNAQDVEPKREGHPEADQRKPERDAHPPFFA